MADFTQIIQEINDNINTNGVGTITGAKLNEVLRDIVAAVNAAKADILPDGSVFGGFALTNTPPTYGDNHQFYYIAEQSGTYEYYNNIQLDGRFFAMLFWNGLQWDYFLLSYTPNGLGGELHNYLRKDNLYQRLGFSLFSPNETYHAGDVTVYNGVLYQFNNDHTGAWTGNDVDQTDLFTIMWNNFDDAFFLINDLGNNKADKVSGATAGDFAGLDADGNLTDSGGKASDFATAAQGTKADTAYQKPSGGIPSSDMTTAVQTSLGKADSAYQLPSGGIPASDLAAAVQTSLGKADTALQSYTETDPIFQASPAAGITAGDISDWDGKADPIPVVDASTIPASMDADKVYQYGTLSGDTTFPALATPSDLTVAHVYCWTFSTPSTAPTITWPSAITSWAGGSAPTINASKSYEVSVMDGFATIIEN